MMMAGMLHQLQRVPMVTMGHESAQQDCHGAPTVLTLSSALALESNSAIKRISAAEECCASTGEQLLLLLARSLA